MTQSAILRICYEAVYKRLADLGKETQLFALWDTINTEQQSDITGSVYLGVSDLGQVAIDKNGEKINVGDVSYEIPVRIACIFHIKITAKTYPIALEIAGKIIQFFKDSNMVDVGEYGWHGNDDGVIYLEPVIHKPESHKYREDTSIPSLSIEYCIEAGINSEKGSMFKRVEKRKITGNFIESS